MIKALRKRMALLLALAIMLALLGASGGALLVTERQMSLREQATFLGRLDLFAQDVRMERNVSSARLAKTEVADKLVLTVYDNGQPISFRGGWQPVTPREELFNRAIEAAERVGVSIDQNVIDARYVGELRGLEGERYWAAVQTIGGYRNHLAVVMLQDMRSHDAQRVNQRWLLLGITLLAVSAMWIFGWRFTARAVKPIAGAYDEQNAFIAAASHELRTPLQIMQTSLDALKGEANDPERFTGAMQRELDRMKRLSEDLTLLTNADWDMSALFGPVELMDLLDEAVRDHRAAAEAKQIELTLLKPKAPLSLIEGDSMTLSRAINVLIENAISYTQVGGHVQVLIVADQRHQSIAVRDDGPGIPLEHREHIFERFYRVDQSRSDRTHSGLGLCIARQIVEHHNGRLSFKSVEPHGCSFIIVLPCLWMGTA